MTFEIRTATRDDAQSISDIYNHYVDCSTCTFDLTRESLAERIAWLEARTDRHPVVVCLHEQQIIGWGSLSQWNPRPGYARTAEVSFYVRHDWHRRGVGRLILSDLIARARRLKHRVLIGGASADQVASIRLQEDFGFVKVAHFRDVGYKFGRWLDVVYFQLHLDAPAGEGLPDDNE